MAAPAATAAARSGRSAAAGAAAADAANPRAAAFTWNGRGATRLSDLAALGELRCCSAGEDHYAAVCADDGTVACGGDNDWGQLGAGDCEARRSLARITPAPAPARRVYCGSLFTVLLHRGGAVSSWGQNGIGQLGRTGDESRPGAVEGLPPIVTLAAGHDFVIAVTAADEAYGWGSNWSGQLALDLATLQAPLPARVGALSGRGISALACADAWGVAGTTGGLLFWGCNDMRDLPEPELLPAAGMQFPLRDLACGQRVALAADAAGAAWQVGVMHDDRSFRRTELAGVVRVAAAGELFVALAADGKLWDVSDPPCCRSIHFAAPEISLGMVPAGGAAAEQVLLISDACAGKHRLHLFARIAVRRAIPCDPVLMVLTNFTVDTAYIVGPVGDPFGCPRQEPAPQPQV